MPSRRNLSDSALRLKCGHQREKGAVRTSAIAVAPAWRRSARNRSNAWVEWPMVSTSSISDISAGFFLERFTKWLSQTLRRHARTCSGHPRLSCRKQDVDGRDEPGHDVEGWST